MQSVFTLFKPVGLTPLRAIEIFRLEHPEYAKVKLGYAGRLDPMAEGLLLVLAGEENKKRKEYEALPKEYTFDVLFGVTTDTYDLLGKITGKRQNVKISELQRKIMIILPTYMGKFSMQYPPYSSKPVHGKPLYWWARKNRLSEIEIPKKVIEIYDLKLIKFYQLGTPDLKKIIFEKLDTVSGDFRQEEIKINWKDFFDQTKETQWHVARFHIHCSSGTYVRSLTNQLGNALGYPNVTLHILRTKVGKNTT